MQNTDNSSKSRPVSRQPIGFWGRVFSSPTFWIGFFILGFGLPLGKNLLRPQVKAPPVYGTLPDLQFIDQDKRPVRLSDYRGRVLLVNFIFTRCPSSCPLLSAQMAKVQKRTVGSGNAVKLLSITVDPENDTPDVLKKYADSFMAKRNVWSFLTGPLPEIEKILIEGFKLSHSKLSEVENLMEFTHAEQFVLVDQIGQIRGYRQVYNSKDIDNVLKDIAIIANTNPSLAPRVSEEIRSLTR